MLMCDPVKSVDEAVGVFPFVVYRIWAVGDETERFRDREPVNPRPGIEKATASAGRPWFVPLDVPGVGF